MGRRQEAAGRILLKAPNEGPAHLRDQAAASADRQRFKLKHRVFCSRVSLQHAQ